MPALPLLRAPIKRVLACESWVLAQLPSLGLQKSWEQLWLHQFHWPEPATLLSRRS